MDYIQGTYVMLGTPLGSFYKFIPKKKKWIYLIFFKNKIK
jgi:hypothetical protein